MQHSIAISCSYSDHADLAAIKAGVDGDIIIPSIINEVPVTGIDKLVFNAKQEFSSITIKKLGI